MHLSYITLAFLAAFVASGYAAEQKAAGLSADEQKNVERVCGMTHRPGAAMRECTDQETKKVSLGKQTQSNNRDMEALTAQQIEK